MNLTTLTISKIKLTLGVGVLVGFKVGGGEVTLLVGGGVAAAPHPARRPFH